MSKPLLAIGLLVVMAGAWYWALLPAMPPPSPREVGTRASAPSASRQIPIVRLDGLAAQAASRPVPGTGRNPFGHVATMPMAPEARPVSRQTLAAGQSDASAVSPTPAWPRLELIGVAEAREASGLVRTAIMSGPHGVLHARPGDVLEQVYRLERVAGDGVEVRLLPEDRVLRLALRR